jgi:hypothetical protein
MKFMFVIWGGLGLLGNIVTLLSLFATNSVGVGTSAYVSAIALIWIGGMVFFGLGSLLFKKAPKAVLDQAPVVADMTEERQAAMSWAEREQRQ